MNEFAFDINKIATSIVYLLSCFYSLRLIGSKTIPTYLRGFYWYSIIGALTSLMLLSSIFFSPIRIPMFSRINSVTLIFHFSFLTFFIFRILKNDRVVTFLKVCFWIILFLLIVSIANDVYFDTCSLSFCVANVSLFLFCLFYYYQILHFIPAVSILKEPSFWIITGIFIGMGLSFPMIIFLDFFSLNTSLQLKREIQFLGNLPYIVMHLCFIKAYLCSSQIQKA